MTNTKIYPKIEEVLRTAGKPIAAHEFSDVIIRNEICLEPGSVNEAWDIKSGRQYVGVTEATLARRLREMRELGRVTSKRREGKAFVEYALAGSQKHEAFHGGFDGDGRTV